MGQKPLMWRFDAWIDDHFGNLGSLIGYSIYFTIVSFLFFMVLPAVSLVVFPISALVLTYALIKLVIFLFLKIIVRPTLSLFYEKDGELSYW